MTFLPAYDQLVLSERFLGLADLALTSTVPVNRCSFMETENWKCFNIFLNGYSAFESLFHFQNLLCPYSHIQVLVFSVKNVFSSGN